MKKIPEGYKETELGVIPQEWEVKELGSLAKNKGEYGIGAKAIDYIHGKPRYLRITDIDDKGYLIKNEDYKTIEEEDYEKYILRENDLVFARTGNTTGKTYLYKKQDGRLIYAGFLIKFELDDCKVNATFVKYSCQTKLYWDWVNKSSTRSGQPGINSKQYAELLLVVPTLPEQQKIAEILSSVDDHIEKLDETISEYELLKKGMMKKLLTEGIGHTEYKDTELGVIPKDWEVRKLGEISNFRQGFQISRNSQQTEPFENSIRYLYITDFFSDKNILFVQDKEDYYHIQKNDICIANTGNTCGKSFRGAEGLLSNNMFKIFIEKEKVSEGYYWHYLQSDLYWSQLSKFFNSAGQPHVGHKNMSILRITIPSLAEQQQIASILSSIDERIELYKSEKEDFVQVKKGLMEKLLTGKIRVNSLEV